jgi:UDP-N-acetylmuramyl pentapeptide phosphotransferase/UDP-N-acetylglucosamine-1-phosphate transferase
MEGMSVSGSTRRLSTRLGPLLPHLYNRKPMSWALTISLPVAVAALSWLATAASLRALERRKILDMPNERSSHKVPVPRGGGIGVMLALLPVWLGSAVLIGDRPVQLSTLALGALGLAILSWVDDRGSLSPLTRLVVQAFAVALGLWVLGDGDLVFQGWLPPWLDRAAAGLLWLWFVNLYNFMDGIDGITGVETIALGIGLALLAALGLPLSPIPPLILAAAALGFLCWNWHPARIFLGDVGSVPLGFLLGGLLLEAAQAGAWAASLILPLYYLADATYTLLARLARGERIWQAHRQHFYQRAVQGGWSHARVARSVLGLDTVLILLALVAQSGYPLPALALAALACLMLLIRLGNAARRAVL